MLPIVNVDTKIYIRGVVVTKEKVTEKVFENQPNFTVSANATNQSRETVKLAENSIHNIFNKFVSDKNFKSNTIFEMKCLYFKFVSTECKCQYTLYYSVIYLIFL